MNGHRRSRTARSVGQFEKMMNVHDERPETLINHVNLPKTKDPLHENFKLNTAVNN